MPVIQGYGAVRADTTRDGAGCVAGVVIPQGEGRRPGRVMVSSAAYGTTTNNPDGSVTVNGNAPAPGWVLLTIYTGAFAVARGATNVSAGREILRQFIPTNTTQVLDLADVVTRAESDDGPAEGLAVLVNDVGAPDGSNPAVRFTQVACSVLPAREAGASRPLPYTLR